MQLARWFGHTSTKSTISSMTSRITACAVATEAARAARGLTVVSSSKPTWKSGKRCINYKTKTDNVYTILSPKQKEKLEVK